MRKPGATGTRRAATIIAGKPAFSLKGYEELADLVARIATARRITMPEVLDRYALANLRRAAANLPELTTTSEG